MSSKGLIFIGGGGNAEESKTLDKNFITSLSNDRLLYIPLALEPKTDGYNSCLTWLTNSLKPLTDHHLDIKMLSNIQDISHFKLENFSAIYIGGGNTYKLLNLFHSSGFDSQLIKYHLSGGTIYGGSAGAIILGNDIGIVSEENNQNFTWEDGLNLLSDHSILCHYKESKINNVFEYIGEKNKKVIALPERTGIKIVNNNALVEGYEPAILFDTNNDIKVYKPGSEFMLI